MMMIEGGPKPLSATSFNHGTEVRNEGTLFRVRRPLYHGDWSVCREFAFLQFAHDALKGEHSHVDAERAAGFGEFDKIDLETLFLDVLVPSQKADCRTDATVVRGMPV